MSYSAEVLTDNPVRYYRLGETSGSTASDSSISGVDWFCQGTVVGGAGGLLVGDANGAYNFDGVDDQISGGVSGVDTTSGNWTLEVGETIALGFDGSDTRDATALVAITTDGCLVPVEIVERPAGADEWHVDRSRIERAVEWMFSDYRVLCLFADPWGWRTELEGWADKWPDQVVEVPMNSPTRSAELVDRFRTAVAEGTVTHNGDPDLRRHVLNARLRKIGRDESGLGRYAVAKAGPGRLIDACAASLLALEALAASPAAAEPWALAW
jgi:phage terminase large subunit-like protein